MPGLVKVEFEEEWAVWITLVAARSDALHLPPAQIETFARSRGARAKIAWIGAVSLMRNCLRFAQVGL